jgi:hypothetical protein
LIFDCRLRIEGDRKGYGGEARCLGYGWKAEAWNYSHFLMIFRETNGNDECRRTCERGNPGTFFGRIEKRMLSGWREMAGERKNGEVHAHKTNIKHLFCSVKVGARKC